MPNVKIPNLPAASSPSPQDSDLTVLSPSNLTDPTYKFSLANLKDYFGLTNNDLLTVYVDSESGVDAVGRGSQPLPYKTISFAISQITTNSSTTPFLINAFGVFSDSTWVLKPWIQYNFNGATYAVSGAVSLDASFSTGGNVSISNLGSFSCSSIGLDFDAISQTGTARIYLNNILTSSAFSTTITGSLSGSTMLTMYNFIRLGSYNSLTTTNTSTTVLYSNANNLSISNSKAGTTLSGLIANNIILGNTSISSTLGTANYLCRYNDFFQNVYFGSNSVGVANCFVECVGNTTANIGTLTVEQTGASADTSVSFDQLLRVPTQVGTPTITYPTISSGMTVNYTPVNFTPTTPELTGYIEGIDDALGDALPATQQAIYDNSSTGNVNLSSGKHQGYSGTSAVFYTPSMSNAQFAAVPSLPNGGIAWSVGDDRFNVNKGSSGSPVIDQLAYTSDISGVTNNSVYGEMCFNGNTTQTVITEIGTAVKIAGTYVSGRLLGFGQSSGTLTRATADADDVFSLNISLTASPVSSSCNLTFIALVDGSDSTTTNVLQSVDFDAVLPSQKSISISGSISIPDGSNVQIFVKNNTAAENILFQNFNCFITSIGGVNEGANATLNSAYVDGDGTITQTANVKPVEVNSTDNAIIPTIQTNQLDTPTNGTVVCKVIALADGVQYGLDQVTVSTVGQHSTNVWQGLSSGSETSIFTYTGSNKTVNSPNFMTVGSNAQGVNSTLATVTVPVESYGTGTGTFLMWSSINGTPNFPANTFGPGDTIEIDVTGKIHIAVPDTAVVFPSYFNIVVGGGALIDLNSSNINTSTLPTSFTGVFQWKFKMVRTPGTSGNNGITVSGSGFFEDTNGSMKLISFPSGLWTTAYVPSGSYSIAVNYIKGISAPGGAVDYIAYGLNIKQYS